MGAAILDLGPLVAGAKSNDGGAACNTSTDSAWGVLEDNAIGGFVAEALGGEEEGIGSGFPSLETFVIGSDGDGGRSDSDARHATIS